MAFGAPIELSEPMTAAEVIARARASRLRMQNYNDLADLERAKASAERVGRRASLLLAELKARASRLDSERIEVQRKEAERLEAERLRLAKVIEESLSQNSRKGLARYISPIGPRRGIEEAIQFCAREFGVGREFIMADIRRVEPLIARYSAIWLARRWSYLSYPSIGRVFNGRDHTTIIHAENMFQRMVTNLGLDGLSPHKAIRELAQMPREKWLEAKRS